MNSTSVITVTPDLTHPSNIPYTLHTPNNSSRVRTSQLDIEYYSYTDYDIDVLLQPGTAMHAILHLLTDLNGTLLSIYCLSTVYISMHVRIGDLLYFTGEARHRWKHGIRNGLSDPAGMSSGVYDWYVSSDKGIGEYYKRSNDRVSVVLGFS